MHKQQNSQIWTASSQAISYLHFNLIFFECLYMTGTYKEDTAGHRLVGKTSSQWQCDKCCDRGMHKVCTGTWRKDMQGFYGDLEERIYKSSRQELQKVSEKISRVRNILQDCQFYLYNNSGRLVNRNCYFFLQDTGMRGDLNTVPELTAKQD